jgi:hypothetical protein
MFLESGELKVRSVISIHSLTIICQTTTHSPEILYWMTSQTPHLLHYFSAPLQMDRLTQAVCQLA